MISSVFGFGLLHRTFLLLALKQNSDHQVIIEDFYPSILEMAGIDDLKTIQKIDGQSFVSVLKGEMFDGVRPLFWHYPNEWGPTGPGIGAASAIRKGEWKLIFYHADRRMELFNLHQDISETTNVFKDNIEKAKELATTLTNHLKAVNAQMPMNKETGEVIAFPDADFKTEVAKEEGEG